MLPNKPPRSERRNTAEASSGFPNPIEVKRLHHLWERAAELQEAASKRWQDGRLQAGRDRIAYFEKLALFSGATIALLVSALASGRVQISHKYSLRAALISLVIAMCSAMARNWFYSYYFVIALGRIHAERQASTLRAKFNYVRIHPTAIDEDTGELFDPREAQKDFEESEAANAATIKDVKRSEKRFENSYVTLEWLAHLATIAGIVLLTLIAILTF